MGASVFYPIQEGKKNQHKRNIKLREEVLRPTDTAYETTMDVPVCMSKSNMYVTSLSPHQNKTQPSTHVFATLALFRTHTTVHHHPNNPPTPGPKLPRYVQLCLLLSLVSLSTSSFIRHRADNNVKLGTTTRLRVAAKTQDDPPPVSPPYSRGG